MPAFAATHAHAADLWVDIQNPTRSEARTSAQVTSSATPWCTLAQARAGYTVHILDGVYRGTLRPLNSGSWNGSRTTLAGRRTKSGQDARSLDSRRPTFDSGLRVVSTSLGASRGDRLGLVEDFAGTPLPTTGRVDIGAYQQSG